MPLYDFKHNETGTIHQATMPYAEKDAYMEEHNLSSIFLTMPSVIGDTKEVHSRTTDDFKERMGQIKKGAGRDNTL